ncbi:MAG: IS21 family transposase [Terriglobales bacterium]
MLKLRIKAEQYRWYMMIRKSGATQKVASLKSGLSERSARRIEKTGLKKQSKRMWVTRVSNIKEVWENTIIPLIEKQPNLSPITLLEYLQELYPGQYENHCLRTLQRYMRKWRALNGKPKNVMFEQKHVPARLGLSDFTELKGIQITIQGNPFDHLLYHFRLSYSHWSFMNVVVGGESFSALSKGLQDALWKLGGVPYEHRTDSLSAAFKNLNKDDVKDYTDSYANLCLHYKMKATRNNRGQSHENGSIESPHGHLKRRIKQALLLRQSYDFESIESYQGFIHRVVDKFNRNQKISLEQERPLLQDLPHHRTTDFKMSTARVSTFSMIRVKGITYTVPSRLIGHSLQVHIYHDKISCYLNQEHVGDFPYAPSSSRTQKRYVNYRHVIHSLVCKPQAFRYSALRDDLLPTPGYKEIWSTLDQLCPARQACKLMVGILKIASDYDCESSLENYVLNHLKKKQIPCLETLEKRYTTIPDKPFVPIAGEGVSQHVLDLYDQMLPNLLINGTYHA